MSEVAVLDLSVETGAVGEEAQASINGSYELTRDVPQRIGNMMVTVVRISQIAFRIGSQEYEAKGGILRHEGKLWTTAIKGASRVTLDITDDVASAPASRPVPRSQRVPLRNSRPGNSSEKKPFKYD